MANCQMLIANCCPLRTFMPLVNAFSKAVVRDFSLEELEEAARLMRGYDLVALCAAGSGNAGGTLSVMEIVAALYLKGRYPRSQQSRMAASRPNHLVGSPQGSRTLPG